MLFTKLIPIHFFVFWACFQAKGLLWKMEVFVRFPECVSKPISET